MRWEHFVAKLKGLDPPFRGNGDDFDEVVAWLKSNDLDSEAIEDSRSGQTFVLKELHADRRGRKLDVSDIAAKAQQQDEIDVRVKAAVEEMRRSLGFDSAETKRFRHDIKVGKDNLADDPKGGFYPGEFFCDVIKAGMRGGTMSPKLNSWNKAVLSTYANEASGADGGFLVPVETSTTVLRKVTGEGSLLSRTRSFRTAGNSFSFPVDEQTPWGTSGIQSEWRGEAGVMTQRKPVLTQKTLRLKGHDVLVPVTEELMEDAPGIGSYISELATDVIDFKVGEAFFRGTGVTQPLGFLNSGGLVTVTKEASQGNQTVVAYNIMKMWARLYSRYRANAVWFVNQTVETELFQLSMLGRNRSGGYVSGFGRALYMPPEGLAAGPNGSMLGRPVLATEHTEELGGVGDVVLAAMDQYATLQKVGPNGIQTAQSMHLWFDQAVMALRFTLRIDGMPMSDSAIPQRDDATNTYGAFVVISARE